MTVVEKGTPEDTTRKHLEETPDSGTREMSRWTDDPGGGVRQWREERGGVVKIGGGGQRRGWE